MKIILKEEVDNLGLAGDIVDVADGYGRNYLIPRGMAIIATPGAEKEAEALLRARRAREAATLGDAQAMKDTLESRTLRIEKRVDEGGHLYGSVSRSDVHEVLKQRGHDIPEKRIDFGKPIKEIGEYEVPVRVHPQVWATLTYEVVDVEGEVTIESLAAARQAEADTGPPLLDEEGNLITEPVEGEDVDTTDVEALAQQALEAARQFEAEATAELEDDEDAATEDAAAQDAAAQDAAVEDAAAGVEAAEPGAGDEEE